MWKHSRIGDSLTRVTQQYSKIYEYTTNFITELILPLQAALLLTHLQPAFSLPAGFLLLPLIFQIEGLTVFQTTLDVGCTCRAVVSLEYFLVHQKRKKVSGSPAKLAEENRHAGDEDRVFGRLTDKTVGTCYYVPLLLFKLLESKTTVTEGNRRF